MSGFDLAAVEERLRECEDTEAKRDTYREELFDWTDSYTENLASRAAAGDDTDAAVAREAIVKLWAAFAKMEVDESQLENAIAIYKEAAADPIAGTQPSLFRYYTEFLLTKEVGEVAEYPFEHAFFHGLCKAQLDTQGLWAAYLATHNKQRSSSITMQELYETAAAAMKEDEVFDGMQLEKPAGISARVKIEGEGEGEGEEEEEEEEGDFEAAAREADEEAGSKQALSTKIKIKQEPKATDAKPDVTAVIALLNLDDLDGLTPELLVKRFHQAPPMLLEPLATETTMRVLPPLSPQDSRLLEDYLGVSLKDANFLEQCAWLLDILEGLWVAQALKERYYAQCFTTLKDMHATERIRSKERAHTAGGTTSMSMSDLSKHSKKLESKLAVQRELMAAIVNKSLLALVGEQHRILSQLNFPSFSTALWEKVESHVINHKLGAPPSQLDQAVKEALTRQQQLLGAVLVKSGRLNVHAAAVVGKDPPTRQKNTRFSDRTPPKQEIQHVAQPTHVPAPAPPLLRVPQSVAAPAPPTLVVPPIAIKTEKVPAHVPKVASPSPVAAHAPLPIFPPGAELAPTAASRRGSKRKMEAAASAPAPAPVPVTAAAKVQVPAAKKSKVGDSLRMSTTKMLDMDAAELLAAVKPAAKPATRKSTRGKA